VSTLQACPTQAGERARMEPSRLVSPPAPCAAPARAPPVVLYDLRQLAKLLLQRRVLALSLQLERLRLRQRALLGGVRLRGGGARRALAGWGRSPAPRQQGAADISRQGPAPAGAPRWRR
jgi:hypothetical protein